MPKARGRDEAPQTYPANPPPMRPAEIVHLKGDERLEEITIFETKRPKEERSRVVEVREDRDRNEGNLKRGQCPHLLSKMRLV